LYFIGTKAKGNLHEHCTKSLRGIANWIALFLISVNFDNMINPFHPVGRERKLATVSEPVFSRATLALPWFRSLEAWIYCCIQARENAFWDFWLLFPCPCLHVGKGKEKNSKITHYNHSIATPRRRLHFFCWFFDYTHTLIEPRV